MEKQNIFLGKIEKKGCYVNDGKYGWFLSYNKKNYKIPEWISHEKFDLETAQKFIEYKEKMKTLYETKKEPPKESEEEIIDASEEEAMKKIKNKLSGSNKK